MKQDDVLLVEEFFQQIDMRFTNGSLEISKRTSADSVELSDIFKITLSVADMEQCNLNFGEIDSVHS